MIMMTKTLKAIPRRTLFCLALASAAAVSAVPAANGDIPIYQATTITQPGRYVVTRDITAQGDVIVIQAGGVTLDLNGHTITSVAGSGVVFDVPDQAGAVAPCEIVANGRIVGGDTGIKAVNLPAVTPIIIDKVGIVMPMFRCIDLPGAKVEVLDSVLRECGSDGIRMTGNGMGLLDVRDTLITDVQGSGILANAIDGVTVRGSTIRRFGLGPGTDTGGVHAISLGKIGLSVLDSVLADGSARGAGLLMEQAGIVGPNYIVGNRISGNGLSGIDLRQGTAHITNNTISGNLVDGIRVDAAGLIGPNMISGNSILKNTLNGANILGGVVRFNGNTVGGNLQDGVRVAGVRALVENNLLEGNTGAGIRFLNGTGHAYRSNFLRGNTGGDVQDSFNNTDAGGNIK
jgi:hypothetical protein